MKVVIRNMKFGDLPQVIKINESCLPENYEKKNWDNWFHNGKQYSFVAICNGELCGYLLCDKDTIVSIAILPKYRDKKIGTNLILNCLTTLSNNVILHCREENLKAIKLYKTLGFNLIYTKRGYYQNPPDNGYVMEWEYKDINNNTKKMNI